MPPRCSTPTEGRHSPRDVFVQSLNLADSLFWVKTGRPSRAGRLLEEALREAGSDPTSTNLEAVHGGAEASGVKIRVRRSTRC